jgi:hypothetical protein
MSIFNKIIKKIKSEISNEEFKNILLNPLYENITIKIAPYYIFLIVLHIITVILVILIFIKVYN